MRKFIPEITLLITGSVVMILELAGSRILSPYLGSSILIWTSLIGIILGCLSLGYYLGGKISDKKATLKNLSQILLIAATLIAITSIIKNDFLQILTTHISDIRISSIIATIILFGPANIFLGIISPYCVKLKLDTLSHSGQTVGTLYALSTIGSILGTFFGGFYLVALFGNTKLLLLLSIVLILLSLFVDSKNFLKSKIIVLVVIILRSVTLEIATANFETSHLLDLDTTYSHVQIKDNVSNKNISPTRLLLIGQEANSGIYLNEKKDELLFEYTKYYDLAFHFKPDLKKALMIGGGAFSYPNYFIKNHPEASIDVVEIDPELQEIAKKYFNLKENPKLKIISADGRAFLNQNKKKYDVIFGDAFRGAYAVPYQLTTIESMQLISDSLNENGLFIANIISSIDGSKNKFLQAEYKTLKEVFPQVLLFQITPGTELDQAQNLILVGLKSSQLPTLESSDPATNSQLQTLWTKNIQQDIEILTDDFAPVDNYMLDLL